MSHSRGWLPGPYPGCGPTIAEVTPGAITLTAKFDVDRTQLGVSWNRMGMLRGPATMTATLRFTRS